MQLSCTGPSFLFPSPSFGFFLAVGCFLVVVIAIAGLIHILPSSSSLISFLFFPLSLSRGVSVVKLGIGIGCRFVVLVVISLYVFGRRVSKAVLPSFLTLCSLLFLLLHIA